MEIEKRKSQRREKKGGENKILDFKFTNFEQWVVYVETYCSWTA